MKNTIGLILAIMMLSISATAYSSDTNSLADGAESEDSVSRWSAVSQVAREGRYETATDSARIWFRQSRSLLERAFKGNGDSIAALRARIGRLKDEEGVRLKSIKVVGSASPEGSTEINRRLSERRAEKIFGCFSEELERDSVETTFSFLGRDWQGLADMIASDEKVPYRDATLSLVENITSEVARAGKDNERNLLRLKHIGGGVPYAYLYRNIFPALRYSRIFVEYERALPERWRPVPTAPLALELTAPSPEILPIHFSPFRAVKEGCRHPFYMGLKTNLLYDAAALPTIGAEFYIGKKWSVLADWTYGWWDTDPKHYYWRAYGGDIGVRRWFGKAADAKPLTGHHIGLVAGITTYDFEFGGRGWMGGIPGGTLWDRCRYLAGVEYGYALPIARRLNLDFSLALGYLGGKVVEYVPKGDVYEWQSTRFRNWFGPVKAEVSLVWLIGCDNYNRRGGER